MIVSKKGNLSGSWGLGNYMGIKRGSEGELGSLFMKQTGFIRSTNNKTTKVPSVAPTTV